MDEPIREVFSQISVSDDDRAIIMTAWNKATQFASNIRSNYTWALLLSFNIGTLHVSSVELYWKLYYLIWTIVINKSTAEFAIMLFNTHPLNLSDPIESVNNNIQRFIGSLLDPDEHAYAERFICRSSKIPYLSVTHTKGALPTFN